MEKFLKWKEGSKPLKKRKSEDCLSNGKKEYEKKRVRKYQEHWALRHDWLFYENEKMYCRVCQQFGDLKNPFVNGCTTFKLEALTSHESTRTHTAAMQKFKRPTVEVPATLAGQALIQMKENERSRMNNLFRNAHFFAKRNLSFKTYTALCSLDKTKGIDIGETYLHDKACALFTKHIAMTEHEKTRELFHSSPFVSISCDGTSDYTGDEYESLFMRCALQGKITERFVNVGTTTSSTGEDIFNHINATLRELVGEQEFDFWTKVSGFCSDGASNMQGKHKGVAAFVRQKNQETLIMHCMAHRVELAYKDSVKKIKLYDKAITLLMGLYYLYRKSPKLKQELKHSFRAINKKVVLPTRIGGTRWLPHLSRSISVFLKGYMAFRLHLETASHTNPKAEGLAKLLSDSSVVVFILDLKVIFAPLMKLSLMLQERCSSLADSHFALEGTCDVLLHLKTSLDEEVKDVFTSKMYQGEKLKGAPSIGFHETLIENLLQCLNDRFPMTEVVKACEIICLRNWPRKQQSRDFGIEAVKSVFTHFKKTLHHGGLTEDITVDELLHQWVFLKSFIYNKYGDSALGKLSWEEILSALPETYSNIKLLFDLLLSLPATSVNNESCFSLAKLTKTKRRGHLTTGRLSDLLALEISSPSIQDFDPTEAVNHWMVTPSGRRRRVCYTRESVHKQAAVEVPLNTTEFLIATKITDVDMLTADVSEQPTLEAATPSDLEPVQPEPATVPPTFSETFNTEDSDVLTETLVTSQQSDCEPATELPVFSENFETEPGQQENVAEPLIEINNQMQIDKEDSDSDDSGLSDLDSDSESGDDFEITEEDVKENLRRFTSN